MTEIGLPDHIKFTTRLRGYWLTLARVVWIILSVGALAVFAIGTFNQVQKPLPGCTAQGTDCGPWVISREDIQLGQQLGLSGQFLFALATSALWLPRLIMIVIAGIIYWRKSSDWMALMLSLLLMLGITEGVNDVGLLLPLQETLYSISIALFVLIPFVFPNGRFVPRWTRWLALPLVIAYWVAQAWPQIIGVVSLAWISAAVYAVIVRYRRVSNAVERQQTKWVLTGLLGSTIAFIPIIISTFAFPPAHPTSERLAFIFLIYIPIYVASSLLFPSVCIAISIFSYRLWDIDIIINRALVYGTLTGIIISIYILLVGGLGYLFQAGGNLLFSLLVTGLIAVLFQPLRERLQRAANRLLYGERDDPILVLENLGRRLDTVIAPQAVLPTVVEAISQALRLPYVAVMLTEGNDFVLAASCGKAPASSLTCERIPLNYQSEQIGKILVAPRSGEDAFTADEKSLLQNIARQVGIAAYAAQLTRDLQRSRERLVSAREEERRRLRRDLHDGLGPTLASQSLTLEAIEKLITQDPIKALSLTRDLKGQTRGAVQEIRRIINDLRPPTLDDLGLLEALRERFVHLEQSRLRVVLDAPEKIPPLPAAVETAVYRIAVEAVTNVIRHADARECLIQLRVDDNLRLEINDDGEGLPFKFRAGVGLRAMQERAEELGGTFRIERTADKGTHLLIELPISEETL